MVRSIESLYGGGHDCKSLEGEGVEPARELVSPSRGHWLRLVRSWIGRCMAALLPSGESLADDLVSLASVLMGGGLV